jgi:DNA-binding transcriptional regulator YiaG
MYHYEASGLPYVFLKNGFERVETPYGKGVTIHDLPGLHKAIAQILIGSTHPLLGCEFRFLRTELGLSQAELGELLGRDVQSVARWEKGRNQRVDPAAERVLRVLYRETLSREQKRNSVIDYLRELDAAQRAPVQIVARARNAIWHAKAERAAAG